MGEIRSVGKVKHADILIWYARNDLLAQHNHVDIVIWKKNSSPV